MLPGMNANTTHAPGAKSTVEEIRKRFDNDVERFSNLETGQKATMDAPISMELITQAAAGTNPEAKRILDIGCGAGNNTLKLLQYLQPAECHLLDLSQPMLERAETRVRELSGATIRTFQADLRVAPLEAKSYDIIIAAAVLHHLRDDADWEFAFGKIFNALAPGGSFWVTDYIAHEGAPVSAIMNKRFGDYLVGLGGEEYREKVFAYIEVEDTPRSVTYQLELMRRVGFVDLDILHKNTCFAAFGGRRPL
jgi:tRNA (cmo5U34)-methyltransferase